MSGTLFSIWLIGLRLWKRMSKPKTSLKEPDIDNRLIDERGPTREWIEKSRESPINHAVNRGQISRVQFAAAEKFRGHWYKSGLCEHFGTIDFGRVFGGENDGAGMAKTELQAAHRFSFRKAVKALKGHAPAVTAIVCAEQPIIEWGYQMGYRKREKALSKALQAFRGSMDILCREWGLST
jgi:hypothetical protein